jgi:hypothetical protein
LLFSDLDYSPEAVSQARRHANLSLLAADGGILGTVRRPWHSKDQNDHEFHGLAVSVGAMGARTKAPDARCKFLLGDFGAFGAFLAEELSNRGDAEDAADA